MDKPFGIIALNKELRAAELVQGEMIKGLKVQNSWDNEARKPRVFLALINPDKLPGGSEIMEQHLTISGSSKYEAVVCYNPDFDRYVLKICRQYAADHPDTPIFYIGGEEYFAGPDVYGNITFVGPGDPVKLGKQISKMILNRIVADTVKYMEEKDRRLSTPPD